MTYKATPEQWAQCEDWVRSSVVGASDACILELRDRVEALEACCALMDRDFMAGTCDLRAARRPKPSSLKEQALDDLHIAFDRGCLSERQADTIRRALEQIDD
jgi:hypothetical protein